MTDPDDDPLVPIELIVYGDDCDEDECFIQDECGIYSMLFGVCTVLKA
jgi:hypothetical protein